MAGCAVTHIETGGTGRRTVSAQVSGGLSVLLSGAAGRGNASVGNIVAESARGTDLHAGPRSISVCDDSGGDATGVAVTVEQVVARQTLATVRGGNADVAARVALGTDVDGDVVEPESSRTGKHAGVVGSVPAVGNGALPDALVCHWVVVHAGAGVAHRNAGLKVGVGVVAAGTGLQAGPVASVVEVLVEGGAAGQTAVGHGVGEGVGGTGGSAGGREVVTEVAVGTELDAGAGGGVSEVGPPAVPNAV